MGVTKSRFQGDCGSTGNLLEGGVDLYEAVRDHGDSGVEVTVDAESEALNARAGHPSQLWPQVICPEANRLLGSAWGTVR
jgi:hypothetical protein